MTAFITQEEFIQSIMKLEKKTKENETCLKDIFPKLLMLESKIIQIDTRNQATLDQINELCTILNKTNEDSLKQQIYNCTTELNLYKEHMSQQREILMELEIKYLTDVKALKENVEEQNNMLSEQEKERECKFDDLQREINGKFDEIHKETYGKFLCLQQDLQLEQLKYLEEINDLKSKTRDQTETLKQHISEKECKLDNNLTQILGEFLELKEQVKFLDNINDLISQSRDQKEALIKHIADNGHNFDDIKIQISKLKNEQQENLNKINETTVKFDDIQKQILNTFLEHKQQFKYFKSQATNQQINEPLIQLCNDIFYMKTQIFKIVNGLNIMEGMTPLHLACEYGLADMALGQISKQTSLNVANKEGMTPLHLSCKYGLNDVSIKLLNHGADVNVCNKEEMKPLHFACKNDIFEIYKPLTMGCYIIKYKNDKSHLHFVNKDCKDMSVVKKLLNNKADINCKNSSGWTPLHFAAHSGNNSMVSDLLDLGAQINSKTNNGCSPLHLVASGGYMFDEVVHFEDNYLNKYKDNILFLNSCEGHLTVVSTLLYAGAEIDCKDNFYFTPLHVASFAGHEALVIELLNCNADIKCKTKKNEIPLHFAARMGHTSIVIHLLNKGVCINSKDLDGDTPLNLAAATGHISTITTLLTHGADITCKNKEHKTALDLATEMKRIEAIKILKNVQKRRKII